MKHQRDIGKRKYRLLLLRGIRLIAEMPGNVSGLHVEESIFHTIAVERKAEKRAIEECMMSTEIMRFGKLPKLR
jgi:hypothetical protein